MRACQDNRVRQFRSSCVHNAPAAWAHGPLNDADLAGLNVPGFPVGAHVAAGLSARCRLRLSGGFRGLQIHGARLAALVLLQVVRQALVLDEAAHAGTLDGGDVNEGVVAAPVRLDEAVALALVEKFYGADRHVDDSFVWKPEVGSFALGVRDGRNEEPQSARDRQFATSSGLYLGAIRKNCKATAKINNGVSENRADVLNVMIAGGFLPVGLRG